MIMISIIQFICHLNYVDCWNNDPSCRPTSDNVIIRLNESKNKIINGPDFITIINDLVNNTNKMEGILASVKQRILDRIKNHKVSPKEIFNWLIKNSVNNSNAFDLLGDFNYLGIETNIDKVKAFKFYKKAADLGNSNSLGYYYNNDDTVNITRNTKKKCLNYTKKHRFQ
jgi:TPR repeat protein